MKTSELIGPALDWAVAAANVEVYESYRVEDDGLLHAKFCGVWLSHSYNPSTDWSQGGPIIEQEKISVMINDSGVWIACMDYNYSEYPLYMQAGETALVAAIRSYVASKLGDDVDIPEELL